MAEQLASWEALDGAADLKPRLSESRTREAWKYTRVQKLLEAFGDRSGQAEIASSTEASLTAAEPTIDTEQFPLGLLTVGQSSPTQLVISADGDYELRLLSGDHHQVNVFVEDGVNATLIERYPAPFNSACLQIDVGQDSTLAHHRLFDDAATLWHLTDVRVAERGHYLLGHYSTGSSVQRIDVRIQLTGRDSLAEFNSAVALASGQHHDLNLEVVHVSPDGRCKLRCHAAVADKATSTCVGRIHIVKDAQRSDADLSCRNLLLADSATANAKPELEIYADDVRCAHGATVGRLDEDALFYLRSRGIGADDARRALVRAFLAEPVDGPLADEAVRALDGAVDAG